jgi:hypothetical protein
VINQFIQTFMTRSTTIACTGLAAQICHRFSSHHNSSSDHFFGDAQTMADVIAGATGTLGPIAAGKFFHDISRNRAKLRLSLNYLNFNSDRL